jgi:hypothetical protein
LEHVRDKKNTRLRSDASGKENKKEVVSTLKNAHWSTPIILKYETRFVKDQGSFKSSNQ